MSEPLDALKPGAKVDLLFRGSRFDDWESTVQPATFLGVDADGRLARFRQTHADGSVYEWDARLTPDGWMSGPNRLSLSRPLDTEES
jgi:hypothetical protein